MIVTRDGFNDVLEHLCSKTVLGLDTETTGLRPYHGDRLFSIIITDESESYYFNFNREEDHLGGVVSEEQRLQYQHLIAMMGLFSLPGITWRIQNAANFDLGILAVEGVTLAGTIHCTKAIGRVVLNDRMDYSLEAQGVLIGVNKSDEVAEYVKDHKLYTDVKEAHHKQKERYMHYEKVPFELMARYGEQDGRVVYALGEWQENKLREMDEAEPALVQAGRTLSNVLDNERRLQKTVFKMKHVGVRIDKDYCTRAAAYEKDREFKLAEEFKRLTGESFKPSSLLFQKVFAEEKENWSKTKKGNPSFDSDAITKLNHPAAKLITGMRDADSKRRFYLSFLYHADINGDVHPNFNPEGVIHGRFSSSNPNFQNLTKEDDEEQMAQEFLVRRALIPRPGFVLIMPDYQQMEYKFALEMACRYQGKMSTLGQMVSDGLDFHDATGKLVLQTSGVELSRKHIKNTNFLTLYGGGDGALADLLGIPRREAALIRSHIRKASPEIQDLIRAVTQVAEERKYVVNWLGRRSYFAWKSMSYKAINYLVSGGCADIVKVAMNRIDEALLFKQSRMIMTVHDELPMEIHESEIDSVPRLVHGIMESVFQSQYVTITAGMEWSAKSLGDKMKGYPV